LPAIVEFGRWQIAPDRREALRNGVPTKLAGRAFDVLVALIEAQGKVVSKDALIQRVWPGRIVEENTLEAQVAAARRALESDRDLIRTVTGRGYQFIGAVAEHAGSDSPARPLPSLPAAPSDLFGREAALDQIRDIASAHRLVTLVGAGGVGKTRLALEAARRLAYLFPDGVALVELAPLSTADHVATAVATALGGEQGAGTATLDGIAALIGSRRILLVLDNCEHLIDAAARLADSLLRADPLANIVATSREPLRTDGEYVYRVASLDVPPENELDPDRILRHGAVRLFDARSAQTQGDEERALAILKAQICRRLDGIPLAIELAAARVRVFGVKGVAARLDDRFGFLTQGGRTALPRQKTLRATLDWSHDLLSEAERVVLCRLAVFANQFSMEAARAVVASQEVADDAVVECVANLVEKSLVCVDASGVAPIYLLLETTRAYARGKLEARGEWRDLALRHAKYHVDLFVRAEADWESCTTEEWIALHSPHLDELRAAIAWSFSPSGDPVIGSELTTAALPLWLQLSLFEECLASVDKALEHLDREPTSDARRRMKLLGARGTCLLYRNAGPMTAQAFERALESAEQVGDLEFQLRASWGLWATTYLGGDYRGGLALAERFVALAETRRDRCDALVGDRMRGMSRYCLGDLAGARRDLESMIQRYHAPAYRSHLTRFIYDQEVVARSTLAHVLWAQGLADQATGQAMRALERARAIDHPPSLCYALTESACPIALMTGGAAALAEWAASAVEATRRHGVSTWKARGQLWRALWRLEVGEGHAYDHVLAPALESIGEARYVVHYTGFVSAVCEQLGRHGRLAEGLALVAAAIGHAERVGDRCSLAELMRVKGELLLLGAEPNAEALAEALLSQALDEARRHEILAWELRAATSLARLLHRQARPARAILKPVFDRFSEGFTTVDLRGTRALLDALP
jgi:predicted ATPase